MPKKGDLPFPEGDLEGDNKIIQSAIEYIPTLESFGFKEELKRDKRSVYDFRGGEDAGQARIQEYIHSGNLLDTYKETRNGLLGANYSSKLSPWLANGCISPRDVYHQTRKYEQDHGENPSTKHFIDELLWRDFFHFYCYHHGKKVFYEYGITAKPFTRWNTDKEIVQRWKEGRTGIPLVDGLMRELNNSGYMGNRGRQIVASYLTLDLKQDWRYGAHHFEEMLLDHDVHSNYGAWNSSAGIGPSKTNIFNVVKQSKDFDPNGDFIRTWVPELSEMQTKYIHDPWQMPKLQQETYGFIPGESYLDPIPSRYTNPQKYQNENGGGKDGKNKGGGHPVFNQKKKPNLN